MSKKKIFIIFFLILLSILIALFFINFFLKKNTIISEDLLNEQIEQKNYNSNIIKNVNYKSRDVRGNEYIIDASEGQIDISNSDIIFLTNVKAFIKMNNSEDIVITSDYGKYKITSEYGDFSIERNSMIISKEVIYTNPENILKADVVKVNIETKDTVIYMHEENKKVNIKSIE